MAELSTLARPYAKAVFEYAEAQDSLEHWSETLKLLSLVVGDDRVKKLLDSPAQTTGQQAAALIEIYGEALDDKGQNLVRLLAENRRLKLLPFMAEQYENLKLQRQKSVDVELVCASEITPAQQESLVAALNKKLDRSINVKVAIDKTLLGGILIRAGDTIIDGSVRGRLTKLAEALNS